MHRIILIAIMLIVLVITSVEAKSKKDILQNNILEKKKINNLLSTDFGNYNHIQKQDVLRRGSIYLIGANTYEFDDAGEKVLYEKTEYKYLDRKNIVSTNYIYNQELGDLTLEEEIIDEYNNNDQIISNITKYVDGDGNLVNSEKFEFDYDASKNLSKLEYHEWDEDKQDWIIWSIEDYVYQNNRLIEKKIQYIFDGDLLNSSYEVTEYTYDGSGNLIEEVEFLSEEDGTFIEYSAKTVYQYNQKNKLVTSEFYEYELDEEEETGDWFQYGMSTYSYDNNDNLIEHLLEFDFGFLSYKTKYEYKYNNTYSYSELFLPFFQDELKMVFNHMLVDINQHEFER